MIQTTIPNLELVTRPRHLIPGPLARLRHQQKASQILKLTYLSHVISIPCVQALLGTSNSNANASIRRLLGRKLMHEVALTSSQLAPNGRVFMLTKQGLSVAQSSCDRDDLHDYDTRPESIRRAQLEHDLTVACIAAHWLQGGGRIIETDLTLRSKHSSSDTKYIKLPDLIGGYGSHEIAFEIERYPKKVREVEQALLLTSRSQHASTIWLCSAPSTYRYLRECLKNASVRKWKLSTGQKWTEGPPVSLRFGFRARQSVVHLDEHSIAFEPSMWLWRVGETHASVKDTVLRKLQREGWTWGAIEPYLEYAGAMTFLFSQTTLDFKRELLVTTLGHGQWHVHRPEQAPEEGMEVGIETGQHPAEGQQPSLGLLEAAATAANMMLVPLN